MQEIKHDHATPIRVNWGKIGMFFLKWFLLHWGLMFVGVLFSLLFGSVKIIGFFIMLVEYCMVGYWIYKAFRGNKSQNLANTPTAKKQESKSSLRVDSIEITNPYAGVFVNGGAGSGKSKSIVEPIIYDAGKKGFTGVFYDFKYPSLAKHVESAYQNNAEIKRWYVNFENLSYSNLINPIAPEYMSTSFHAQEFANTILQNLNPKSIKNADFWSNSALMTLSAVFWYLREENPKNCTIPHAISLIMQPDLEGLMELLQSNQESADMVASLLTAIKSGAKEQVAGVISSLQTSLSKINTKAIYYVMGQGNDFDLNLNDPNKQGVLCVGNSPALSASFGPVIGLLLTVISKQLNQPNRVKSLFLVDEFPTIYIPNVEQLPATARENKVATVLACQDIAQVIDKYGKEKTDTILANLGNQFYGRTTNPDTAKRVSAMFGKEDKMMVSETVNKGNIFTGVKASRSESYSFQEKDLLKVQQVTSLETGSFVVMLSEGAQRTGLGHINLNTAHVGSNIPELRTVSDVEITANYIRIKKEVANILTYS